MAPSLTDFLRGIDLRSQCWCLASTTAEAGFRVSPHDAFIFYAVLDGSISLSGLSPEPISVEAGDLVIALANKPHIVRPRAQCGVEEFEFLNSGRYLDTPASFRIGHGEPVNRILCGRLEVRWPGELHASFLPPFLTLAAADNCVDIAALVGLSEGAGGAAMLTQAASLVFASAVQNSAECIALFERPDLVDPIANALHLIETRFDEDWSVVSLANAVGMGRSAFSTRFLKAVGKPPIAKLTDLRMETSRQLLMESDLKVAEICERVGYYSESAFSRRFMTYFGMTPGRMRQPDQQDGPPLYGVAETSRASGGLQDAMVFL